MKVTTPRPKQETSVYTKYQKHLRVLVWKSYLQRLRRWRILAGQCVFALILCILAVIIAKPAFLTPLEAEPIPPLFFKDLLKYLKKDTILGYAPNIEPFKQVMEKTADILQTEILAATNEFHLNNLLYNRAKGNTVVERVIWILWKKQAGNIYKFSMRSTEVGQMNVEDATQLKGHGDQVRLNPHLEAGFLGVQCAISHALLLHTAATGTTVNYDLSLVAMPVSPLMEEDRVRRAVSLILMCYTLALLPPVLEAEALVVIETERRFKRALRVRNVDYSTMYLGWLMYALFTALPICFIGATTLILIFRWIHLMYALMTLLAYFTVMMMLAFIMSMFQNSALISSIWTIMQTLLQTFLAELIVHHRNFDDEDSVLTFFVKSVLPPLGLLNGFNQFALLRTGHRSLEMNFMGYTILSWTLMIFIYFMLLMLLQRTIGSAKAIGGQVSWKSIIFKQAEKRNKLHPVVSPSTTARGQLQEVDELTAKAASFYDVSKSIMGVPHLRNITFDIYRGEFTSLFSERIQNQTTRCLEDLLTGLTYADSGSINVLGVQLEPSRNLLTEHMMMGYCDTSLILIEDLTVEEHLFLYTEICLWHETNDKTFEFSVIRHKILKHDCDLEQVYLKRVENLGMYYRAQLCWAIAILLEPRLVVLPDYSEHRMFRAVLKDKIMKYKSFITIVSLTVSSMELQYADRLFLLDNRILAFGGTPAYMFYKYGRDYRIRINFKTGTDDEAVKQFALTLREYDAKIRAQLGSLLILRIPTNPSTKIAKLTDYIENKGHMFGVTSIFVSLPDPEEVFRRAIHESRESAYIEYETKCVRTKMALNRLAQDRDWRLKQTFMNFVHLRIIAWKFFACYIHYRFFMIITVLSAIVAGVYIGLSLAGMLQTLESDKDKIKEVDVLTVENTALQTILMLRLDNSPDALSVVNGYLMSHTGTSDAAVGKISYFAMKQPDSLTEYLATRAVDSPQNYVSVYAYGMDIETKDSTLIVRALYSPLHQDKATAARSLARVYMALMRHYSGHPDASIEIEDNPLVVDITLLMKDTAAPPLLIQFLLVLTIFHMTLVPSKEYGLIKHMQLHAMNFSPFRYWFNLAICDIILYWLIVLVITFVSLCILMFILIQSHLHYADLLAVPFMLMVYGVGCVPQAYLFSLGPSASLNSMALIITNVVFGEATMVAKLFYGNAYDYALSFMALSPQFNMAYALIKIRRIFFYNSECIIYKTQKICESKILHKCCSKCGVLQACYKRKSYLSNIMTEVCATLATACLMFTVLMLWEYRIIQMFWNIIFRQFFQRKPDPIEIIAPGAVKEMYDATAKELQLMHNRATNSKSSFGENLLLVNVSRMEKHNFVIRQVCLGLAKGEALALAGLKLQGRVTLCEMIAGYQTRNEGHIWIVSKYRQRYQPHKYARNVVLCSNMAPLPEWMTVYDGLEMLAIMRGVPLKHIRLELECYIDALDLELQEDLQICHLLPSERNRLHFAAAVIGAPPVLVMNECTAYQNLTVQRSMYFIMNLLKERGHSILHSSSSVESHMPVTNRLAILRNGRLFDVDSMDRLQSRYGHIGYTVVVHLKDEVDVVKMFSAYFENFVLNDTSDVLVNMQVMDNDLTWASIFCKMEQLKEENERVYSYIVCTKPIDYIYQNIIADEKSLKISADIPSDSWIKSFFSGPKKVIHPDPSKLKELEIFVKKYSLTKLDDLPWKVIFQR